MDQISDPSKPLYSSVDLLLRATFTQDSIWEDLGVTEQTYRQQVSQNLVLAGWNMVGLSFCLTDCCSVCCCYCTLDCDKQSIPSRTADSYCANEHRDHNRGCRHLEFDAAPVLQFLPGHFTGTPMLQCSSKQSLALFCFYGNLLTWISIDLPAMV